MLGFRVSPFQPWALPEVLEGIPELKVGQGVELQWKMQQGSPFGWWFGTVESLERDAGGLFLEGRAGKKKNAWSSIFGIFVF